MEGLKQTIAVLFRRKGKDALTEKEFVFSASIDMRWFSPKAAQKLLDVSLRLNLLSKVNGELRPNFELDDITVPIDFRPADDIFDVQFEDLFSRILSNLKQSSVDDQTILKRIDELENEFGIEREVAALMLGKELGVDLEDFYSQVENEVVRRARD